MMRTGSGVADHIRDDGSHGSRHPLCDCRDIHVGGEYGGVGAGCGDGNPLGRSDPYGSLQSAVEPGAGKIAGGHMFAFLCYYADNYRAAGSGAAVRKYDCAVCSREHRCYRRSHRGNTGGKEE